MDPENLSSLDSATESAAEEIISQMPDVQEHAIQAAESERAASNPPPAPEGAQVDEFGTPFNPEIHTGSKLKNGRWRERKKKDGAASPKSVIGIPKQSTGNAAPVGPSQDEISARAAGVAAAGSIFMLGMMFGGEEWAPITDPIDEKSNMEKAFGDYFVAKGVQDFPPGAALAIVLLGYAAPRFTMPKTRQRASSIKEWIAIRITKWKVKREFKRRNIRANVSIKGGEGFNANDAILVNGKPLSEFRAETK